MPRVVHFEIFTKDAQRAIEFYRGLFDWTFESAPGHDDYWKIHTGPRDRPGIDGSLTAPYLGIEGGGLGAWVCTVEVDSLDGYAERIVKLGGSIAKERFTIPGYGAMLHGRDPDGNVFGLIAKSR